MASSGADAGSGAATVQKFSVGLFKEMMLLASKEAVTHITSAARDDNGAALRRGLTVAINKYLLQVVYPPVIEIQEQFYGGKRSADYYDAVAESIAKLLHFIATCPPDKSKNGYSRVQLRVLEFMLNRTKDAALRAVRMDAHGPAAPLFALRPIYAAQWLQSPLRYAFDVNSVEKKQKAFVDALLNVRNGSSILGGAAKLSALLGFFLSFLGANVFSEGKLVDYIKNAVTVLFDTTSTDEKAVEALRMIVKAQSSETGMGAIVLEALASDGARESTWALAMASAYMHYVLNHAVELSMQVPMLTDGQAEQCASLVTSWRLIALLATRADDIFFGTGPVASSNASVGEDLQRHTVEAVVYDSVKKIASPGDPGEESAVKALARGATALVEDALSKPHPPGRVYFTNGYLGLNKILGDALDAVVEAMKKETTVFEKVAGYGPDDAARFSSVLHTDDQQGGTYKVQLNIEDMFRGNNRLKDSLVNSPSLSGGAHTGVMEQAEALSVARAALMQLLYRYSAMDLAHGATSGDRGSEVLGGLNAYTLPASSGWPMDVQMSLTLVKEAWSRTAGTSRMFDPQALPSELSYADMLLCVEMDKIKSGVAKGLGRVANEVYKRGSAEEGNAAVGKAARRAAFAMPFLRMRAIANVLDVLMRSRRRPFAGVFSSVPAYRMANTANTDTNTKLSLFTAKGLYATGIDVTEEDAAPRVNAIWKSASMEHALAPPPPQAAKQQPQQPQNPPSTKEKLERLLGVQVKHVASDDKRETLDFAAAVLNCIPFDPPRELVALKQSRDDDMVWKASLTQEHCKTAAKMCEDLRILLSNTTYDENLIWSDVFNHTAEAKEGDVDHTSLTRASDMYKLVATKLLARPDEHDEHLAKLDALAAAGSGDYALCRAARVYADTLRFISDNRLLYLEILPRYADVVAITAAARKEIGVVLTRGFADRGETPLAEAVAQFASKDYLQKLLPDRGYTVHHAQEMLLVKVPGVRDAVEHSRKLESSSSFGDNGTPPDLDSGDGYEDDDDDEDAGGQGGGGEEEKKPEKKPKEKRGMSGIDPKNILPDGERRERRRPDKYTGARAGETMEHAGDDEEEEEVVVLSKAQDQDQEPVQVQVASLSAGEFASAGEPGIIEAVPVMAAVAAPVADTSAATIGESVQQEEAVIEEEVIEATTTGAAATQNGPLLLVSSASAAPSQAIGASATAPAADSTKDRILRILSMF
jgi:hypothetical protein